MGVFYVFKLGPVPTDEAPTTFYAGMGDGWISDPVFGMPEADALAQLAEKGRGNELQCERRLGRAGKKLGFSTAPVPDSVEKVRCGVAVALVLGPINGDKSPLVFFELAKAAGNFWRGRPWEHWRGDQPIEVAVTSPEKLTFEGAILGNGGAVFGLSLYREKGSLARLERLGSSGHPEETGFVESIVVTLNEAEPFVRKVLDRALGLPFVPIPARIAEGQMHPTNLEEVYVLAAALTAVAGLTPATQESIGGITAEGATVTVRAKAPPPEGAAQH